MGNATFNRRRTVIAISRNT